MRKHRPYRAARPPANEQKDESFEAPPRKRTGRPSDYTVECGIRICERMVEGETLRKICLDAEMPDRRTIFRWLTQHSEFRANYTIAIELHADHWADLAQQIADDRSGDYIKRDGKLIPDWENVQRSRLRVDTIKWRTAKLNPKKYSDRFQMSGPDEKPIEQSTIPLMPKEVADELSKTLAKMETQMGLPVGAKDTPEVRIQALLDTGQPVPPDLYQLMQRRREPA
jgi:hypothetical protein